MDHPTDGPVAGRRSSTRATIMATALCGWLGCVTAGADEPKGATFREPQLGLSATGPSGWRVATQGTAPTEWTRLATWFETGNPAEAVLSARRRSAIDVQALQTRVRDEWSASKEITVVGTRSVEPTPTAPIGQVIVDATYVVRPKPAAGADPTVPPPPVPWRIRATYWLAPRGEVLLYAKAPQAQWARFEPLLKQLETSVAFVGAESAAEPAGSGTFRDEKNGFACRYPDGYSVALPAQRNHIVQFAAIDADAPSFDVYVVPWERALDDDVARTQSFYENEQAAETSTHPLTLLGQEATRLEARARIGGRDLLLLTVFAKVGSNRVFRIKATAPVGREGELRRALDAFLGGFTLIPTAR